jgi:acetyltransferase-like isoleucine patch superfamily enzyme
MVHVHPTAIIEHSATIGEDTTVAEHVIIREGASVGARCRIHPFVIIDTGAVVGNGVEVFSGSVIGKPPHGAGAVSRPPVYEQGLAIQDGCSIGPNAIVYHDVTIGEGTLVGDGASIREQGRVGARCIISRGVTLNYNVVLGDDTKVMDLTHLTGDMRLGDRVFVGPGVMTANDNLIGRSGHGSHVTGPVVADDAAIGAGAILLPGVTIGERATVSAGALVSRDVAPDSVVRGIPARLVTS